MDDERSGPVVDAVRDRRPVRAALSRLLRSLGGRKVAAAVLVALVTIAALPPGATVVTLSGFDREERKIVLSAVERFRGAGLELPRTHVRRVGGAGACRIKARSWDVWPVRVVNVCLVREDVVVHELAHVWSFASLSRLDKAAWTTRRQVPSWRSKQHRWENRGSEHAADIITWALYWAERDLVPDRISGPVGFDAYSADMAWLIEASSRDGRWEDRTAGPLRSTYRAPGDRSPVRLVKGSPLAGSAGRT